MLLHRIESQELVLDINAMKGEAPIRRRINASSLNPIACGSGRRRIRHVFGNRNSTWRWRPNHELAEASRNYLGKAVALTCNRNLGLYIYQCDRWSDQMMTRNAFRNFGNIGAIDIIFTAQVPKRNSTRCCLAITTSFCRWTAESRRSRGPPHCQS